MLISHKHRFLFIHIPKVAGMSVTAALEPKTLGPTRTAINKIEEKFVKGLGWALRWPLRMLRVPREVLHEYFTKRLFLHWPLNKLNVYPLHLKARDWQKILAPDVFNSMFKFAFVRNPWDLHVSLYHFVLQDPKHPDHGTFKALGNFERYIEWRVTEGFELQKDFLTDEEGRFIVNFVGRFERLATDFQHVCTMLGLKDVSLPHINASSHRDYRSYYNARTRRLVEERFELDIKTFGYTFDAKTPIDTEWSWIESPAKVA